MSNQDGDEPVGYGKPPKHTQFKKGQSGNPSGRMSRGKQMLEPNPVRGGLLKDIVTVSKGKKKKMSVIDVLVNKYISMAMGGDHKAAKLLFDHCGGFDTLGCWKPEKPLK